MNGRKARAARLTFRGFQNPDHGWTPIPDEIRHHNIRRKEVFVPTGLLHPSTGLPERVAFSFTTSTQVNAARQFYQAVKESIRKGEI